MEERKRVNYQFTYNPKQVYREFKGETKINITNPPSEADIKDFWSNIWSRKKVYNVNAPWLEVLEEEYCTNMTQKHYEVNLDIFLKILTKMKNNTAPGIDLIVAYWWKQLFFLHGPLVGIFGKMFKNEVEIPQWAPLVRTTLLAKNKNTHEAKNYPPIACENIMFKLYTGMLASFVTEHCLDNDIITPEQAGGKKGSWGCTEQLLINKTATEECKNYRRNLICIWLD